jgi:hypothetical protein
VSAARYHLNLEMRRRIQRQRVETPTGRFQTIVLDPLWPMEKIELDVRPQEVGFDYPAMTEEQLADEGRGHLDLLQLGRRLDFAAPRREHSRKPEEFYALVREVSPGPRLDVFSREPHEGFEQYGNEQDKFESSSP